MDTNEDEGREVVGLVAVWVKVERDARRWLLQHHAFLGSLTPNPHVLYTNTYNYKIAFE